MSKVRGAGSGAGEALYDEQYWKVVYGALSNFAEYVEYYHRFRWAEMTKNMTYVRKINMRKKLDRYIWRLHQRLLPAIEANVKHFIISFLFWYSTRLTITNKKTLLDMEVQLALLADYMRNCPTRTMAPQVVDVCMDSLLYIMVESTLAPSHDFFLSLRLIVTPAKLICNILFKKHLRTRYLQRVNWAPRIWCHISAYLMHF